ncbi:root hair specific 12 [Artemisia annua]|uniref:Pectinesterase n=1 Tax=Artemisia annua TaxID=35608 RepID=A0A2U1M6F1_ARTAN|nr:root hair specific 12 [Artemisia annua]
MDMKSIGSLLNDIMTWLSAAGTFQRTCIDSVQGNVDGYLQNSTELTSNSLAITKAFSSVANSFNKRRRLMSDEMPIGCLERPMALVAKDGSSKYKKISDALKAVPEKSKKRFVIYVKKGIYNENLRIEQPMGNVMMIGDGMDSTIVSTTVIGKGFIARDMGFRNTAGPAKHQDVALMSDSRPVTPVDFIFGNSAVVIQNCNMLPRRPLMGQKNMITAQGKFDPNQNTGISIQNCTIRPYRDLSNVQTILGRPWKNYSTTVYVNNMMGSFIDPMGWMPWVGTSAPATIFYAEFGNYGPVVAAVVGTSHSNEGSHNGGGSQSRTPMASIKAVCDTTLYPDTFALNELSKASTLPEFKNCSELLDLAIDHLHDTLLETDHMDMKSIGSLLNDHMTWLSAASTFQQTCIDSVQGNVVGYLQNSIELTSNSLAITKGFSSVANSFNQRRRLMSDEMPPWLSRKDRKLLQNTKLPTGIKADVVVAKDGSDKYKKLSNALKAVPEKNISSRHNILRRIW